MCRTSNINIHRKTEGGFEKINREMTGDRKLRDIMPISKRNVSSRINLKAQAPVLVMVKKDRKTETEEGRKEDRERKNNPSTKH